MTLVIPGTALLKFNTKRWAHRDDFVPVRDADEQATIWAAYGAGKYPSLEILVPQRLPLAPYAAGLHLATNEDADLLRTLITSLALPTPPVCLSPDLFPVAAVATGSAAAREYFDACRSAGQVLPPPLLPVD